MFVKRSIKVLAIVLVAFVFATTTYAFAASNTVPDHQAGDGAGVISGYGITNVAYTLAANPQQIASVSFDLNADAGTVKIKLVSTGSTWYNCTVVHSGNYTATCLTAGATVLSADELRVVASN